MIVRFSQGAQHLTIGIGDDGAETDDGKWHIVPSLTPLRVIYFDILCYGIQYCIDVLLIQNGIGLYS